MEPRYNLAAIDVHKKIFWGGRAGQSEEECEGRKFGGTTAGLRQLAEWLQQKQVKEVAMESTAQYWKPVWVALEEQFHLYLARRDRRKGRTGARAIFGMRGGF